MSASATLALRKEEFSRRVEALPAEVAKWRARATAEVDLEVHVSQLNAISVMMETLVADQRALVQSLDPESSTAEFQDTGFELVRAIIKAQGIWDFFRDKLDLRFSPDFKDVLWIADTIAWDCYNPVMDTAVDAGIVKRAEVREPPLTYLTAEFSPATWVRKSRPNDGKNYSLGTATLPIPVIELPWDHVKNVWEFLSLDHEVGHDLEADLKLRGPLVASLQTTLAAAGVPASRINIWGAWEGEVFADLVGLQLGGPAFAEALMHLLLLPASHVTTFDPDDPHPTHYPRILMNAAYARTLLPGHAAVEQHAQEIQERWVALYGKQPQFDPIVGDFPHVFRALMDTALPILENKTVRELMPYTAEHDARIRAAAKYLETGQNKPPKGTVAPRHCVSASRIAATRLADAGANLAALDGVNDNTAKLIRENAKPGVRAANDTLPHKRFIASFVRATTAVGGGV